MRLSMCRHASIIGVVLLASCVETPQRSKLDETDDAMHRLESQLAADPSVCVDYLDLCEQASSLCLLVDTDAGLTTCSAIKDRCQANLSKYCSSLLDGGPAPAKEASVSPDKDVPPSADKGVPAPAVALVQQKTAAGSGVSSLAVTFSTAPKSGDALVLSVNASSSAPVSVSGGGVKWTLVSRSCQHWCGSVWAGFGASSPTSTVTLSFSAAQDVAAALSEWSGLKSVATFASKSGTTSLITTASITTTQAPALIFATVADDGSSTGTVGAPQNGFVALAGVTTTKQALAQAYKTASTVGTCSTSWSQSGTGWWDSQIVAFNVSGL